MILCLAGAVAVGFFGIAWFNNNPALAGAVNQNSERVFIELAQILFNPWIAGILLSAILAAVMSTLSCQLLVCSSAITEDLYKAFLRKTPVRKSWCGSDGRWSGGGADRHRAGGKPEQPRAGSGELRLGRLRCRVWSGRTVLGDVVADDA